MKPVALLLVLGLAIATLVTCARDDGEPDPPLQTLVPCDPTAAVGDPLACPPDAAVDAAPERGARCGARCGRRRADRHRGARRGGRRLAQQVESFVLGEDAAGLAVNDPIGDGRARLFD